jgi:hypothetical protein
VAAEWLQGWCLGLILACVLPLRWQGPALVAAGVLLGALLIVEVSAEARAARSAITLGGTDAQP